MLLCGDQERVRALQLTAADDIQLVERRLRAQDEAAETPNSKVEGIAKHADRVTADGGIHAQIAGAGKPHIGKQPISGVGERIALAACHVQQPDDRIQHAIHGG